MLKVGVCLVVVAADAMCDVLQCNVNHECI